MNVSLLLLPLVTDPEKGRSRREGEEEEGEEGTEETEEEEKERSLGRGRALIDSW